MIKKLALATFLVSLLTLAGVAQTPTAPTTHLKVGDTAPDFELNNTGGKPVKLSEFRGKRNVVLAFYVLAFTGG